MDLDRNGWTIEPAVLSRDDCHQVGIEIENVFNVTVDGAISAPRGRLVGGRNLLSHWAGWRRLFDQPAVMRLVKQYVGSQAG
ncbi:MAG: hypothetical protein ACR2NZ_22340, partial [Rubripirellula sp.]